MNLFKETENVLIIGDIHAPFQHNDYLEHCKQTYKKYKCNKVVFIGDIIDGHAISYHESDPNGYSPGEELKIAKQEIKKWYKAFPTALVTLGNHDKLIYRKVFTAGLPREWVKELSEVLETPNWKYDTHFILNDVVYTHGEGGGNLIASVLNTRMSVVRGHMHTKFEIIYNASEKDLLFGMNVGCGIDSKKYAFEYAKYNTKRPIIGCGVVLENGKLPILVPMNM